MKDTDSFPNRHLSVACQPFDNDWPFTVHVFDSVPQVLDLTALGDRRRYLFVVDSNVEWFMQKVRESGLFDGFETSFVTLNVLTKSLDLVIEIWTAMAEQQPELAVAVGGGTTCDLTGFAASCYHRGIPIALLPTTLLAMTDASVSGKADVDFADLKNSIGAVHYPLVVVCVLHALDTLDEAEFRSALSEMVKLAVTSDIPFFRQLEDIAPDLGPQYPGLINIVETSCRLKAKIVAANPMIRLHSLYGHVVGHAVESLAIGRSRHGDCVSIGVNAEGFIAMRMGLWPEEDWRRQLALLRSFGLPTTIPTTATPALLLQQMMRDRNATPSAIRMILPCRIGQVYTVDGSPQTPVPVDLAKRYLEEFISLSNE